MSGDDWLSNYTGAPKRNGGRQRADRRAESSADLGAFDPRESYVAMLDLVLTGGNRAAFPYSTLLKIEFDPSSGIRLHYPMETVKVEGHRLGDLYRALTQHRVPSIKATGERADWDAGDGSPVVTRISVTTAE